MSDINDTIREREARYGTFADVATCSQKLKYECYVNRQQPQKFSKLHEEGLHMICHKLARIICGDPNYADSWHDLGGFAIRVAQLLNKEANDGNGNETEKKSH